MVQPSPGQLYPAGLALVAELALVVGQSRVQEHQPVLFSVVVVQPLVVALL